MTFSTSEGITRTGQQVLGVLPDQSEWVPASVGKKISLLRQWETSIKTLFMFHTLPHHTQLFTSQFRISTIPLLPTSQLPTNWNSLFYISEKSFYKSQFHSSFLFVKCIFSISKRWVTILLVFHQKIVTKDYRETLLIEILAHNSLYYL